MIQAYQGYFQEDGRFITDNRTKIPANRRVIVNVLDDEIINTDKENIEELEDEYLLALALERKKNDNGVRWSFEEILAEDGLTIDDLDPEGVELE